MLELFVTGTEHNSGKTFITAGLSATMQSLGYSTAVYKPIQVGAVLDDDFLAAPDLAFVKAIDPYVKTYFSYLFKTNAIPVVAAYNEQAMIEKDIIIQDYQSIQNNYECIITDGTNGISTPLGYDFLEADLIKALEIPLLLVVSPNTSSVNNIIMTINQAESLGIKLSGIIINDYPTHTDDLNIKSMPNVIEKYCNARVSGIIPHIENLKNINPNDLITHILNGVDIEGVFNLKIAKLSM